MFMLLLTGAASLLWLPAPSDHTRISLSRQEKTGFALRRARQALIAHAVSHHERKPGRFGVLPCPDTAAGGLLGEGVAHGSCGSRHVASLGRLPWRTLGISPLRDAAGECLWYAVSGTFKSNPAAWLLNADSPGSFVIHAADGRSLSAADRPGDKAVAVVLAPGAALGEQRRKDAEGADICGGHYSAADYLDRAGWLEPAIDHRQVARSADEEDHWLDLPVARSDFNDRIIYISAAELTAAVYRRRDMDRHLSAPATDSLAHAAARCLSRYGRSHTVPGNLSLPWPAPVTLADHRDERAYDDQAPPSGRLFGRLPNTVDDSNRKTSVSGHRLIRDCPHFSDSKMRWLWKNWKDHLFYAVADAYAPAAGATADCAGGRRCLTLTGLNEAEDEGIYAAVVWFADSALEGQRRGPNAAAADYLDGRLPDYRATPSDDTASYENRPPGPGFNDVLYCLLPSRYDGDERALDVISCPR